jgi:hypothetical protein
MTGREARQVAMPARRRPPPPPTVLTPWARIRNAGGRCVQVGDVGGDATPLFPDRQIRGEEIALRAIEAHGFCPEAQPGEAVDPAALAEMIAWQRWYSVTPPTPAPRIRPGWMLVGKRAFLEAGSPITTSWDFAVPELDGTLVIDASSDYTVHWGDGTTTGPHTSPGGPWPDGDVTHLYQDAAGYTVTVEQTWTATWRVGAFSGALPARVRTAALDLPVREVQAVRNR